MRTVWSRGFSKGNSRSAVVEPRTATFSMYRSSSSTRNRPAARSSWVTPEYADVNQLDLAAGRFLVEVADLLREDAHRHPPRDCADRVEALVIAPGKAVNGDAPLLRRGVLGRLLAADDDVGGAHARDVFQGVLHAPLAEGHQDDDGRHADDD